MEMEILLKYEPIKSTLLPYLLQLPTIDLINLRLVSKFFNQTIRREQIQRNHKSITSHSSLFQFLHNVSTISPDFFQRIKFTLKDVCAGSTYDFLDMGNFTTLIEKSGKYLNHLELNINEDLIEIPYFFLIKHKCPTLKSLKIYTPEHLENFEKLKYFPILHGITTLEIKQQDRYWDDDSVNFFRLLYKLFPNVEEFSSFGGYQTHMDHFLLGEDKFRSFWPNLRSLSLEISSSSLEHVRDIERNIGLFKSVTFNEPRSKPNFTITALKVLLESGKPEEIIYDGWEKADSTNLVQVLRDAEGNIFLRILKLKVFKTENLDNLFQKIPELRELRLTYEETNKNGNSETNSIDTPLQLSLNSKLQSLHLQNYNGSFKYLSNLENLKVLKIQHRTKEIDFGNIELSSGFWKSLRSLEIWMYKFNAVETWGFLENFQNLESLSLSQIYSNPATVQFPKIWKSGSSLRFLKLRGLIFSPGCQVFLQNFINLKELYIQRNFAFVNQNNIPFKNSLQRLLVYKFEGKNWEFTNWFPNLKYLGFHGCDLTVPINAFKMSDDFTETFDFYFGSCIKSLKQIKLNDCQSEESEHERIFQYFVQLFSIWGPNVEIQ